MKPLSSVAITAFAFLALPNFASAQINPTFRVTSDNFKNGQLLKIGQIFQGLRATSTGELANECSPDRETGGNRSPQLSFLAVPTRTVSFPNGTASFVVVATDVTAGGVTHWGMYNIPGTTRSLDEDAGAETSTIAPQIINFDRRLGYAGPCPPRDGSTHNYEFVVYALGRTLTSTEVPPDANGGQLVSAIAQCMCELANAKITGRWSAGTQDGFPPEPPPG